MIYFAHKKNAKEIKIGFSEGLQGLLRRMKQHESYGFELTCALPGNIEDEGKLHEAFKKYRMRKQEWFEESDEILEFCELLIDRGFARFKAEEAAELPQLPYGVWGPPNLSPRSIEQNGQISFHETLPIRERLIWKAAQMQNNSFTDEWYTPQYLIELAIEAMGGINTDPATSYAVNCKFIKAKTFYTKESNGLDLTRPWIGNIWLNPPYGRGEGSAKDFLQRLDRELTERNINQAITCLNLASMSTAWFTTTVPKHVALHCIHNGRPNFIPPAGKISDSSPNKGIVLSYFGDESKRFRSVFKQVGQILYPDREK